MTDPSIDTIAERDMDLTPDAPLPAKLLKWAGSKTSLVPDLIRRIPAKWYAARGHRQYLEPFAGSAALFFALRSRGWRGPARLSDVNADLINLYNAVQADPDGVAQAYAALTRCYETLDREAFYYGVRDDAEWTDASLPSHVRAARFLFLNGASFNGLVRYNHNGKFNAPWGKCEKLRQPDLAAISDALRNATAHCVTFDFALAAAAKEAGVENALVYLDPPFLAPNSEMGGKRTEAGSESGGFTAYTAGGFGYEDHVRLARWAKELALRGASVMLSASDCGPSWAVYGGLRENGLFAIDVVQAKRTISRDGDGRGSVGELIVYSR